MSEFNNIKDVILFLKKLKEKINPKIKLTSEIEKIKGHNNIIVTVRNTTKKGVFFNKIRWFAEFTKKNKEPKDIDLLGEYLTSDEGFLSSGRSIFFNR